MGFSIEITDPAIDDINDAVTFIARDSHQGAARWLAGLRSLIHSLEEMPDRFAVIPEADELQMPYRSAVYRSHRVVF